MSEQTTVVMNGGKRFMTQNMQWRLCVCLGGGGAGGNELTIVYGLQILKPTCASL